MTSRDCDFKPHGFEDAYDAVWVTVGRQRTGLKSRAERGSQGGTSEKFIL